MKKLLIVEDDRALLKALFEMLSHYQDMDIRTATNGADGLTTALAEHPDLLVIDILMPNMDGLTMLSKIREDEWGKTAPAVILTNYSDDTRTTQARKQGALDYIIKSDTSLKEIVAIIRRRLGNV